MKPLILTATALTFALAGCNQNTAIGNDREAGLYPAPEAVPVEPASAAVNVATALIKPETMSQADIGAIGGTAGRCVFRLTEVGFPTFVFEPGAQGFIKLNGKLIALPASGEDRFASDGLLVATRRLDDTGNAGMQAQEVIVVPPGAKDELGYHGYVSCEDTA